MRKAVLDLLAKGALPAEDNIPIEVFWEYEKLITNLDTPLTEKEATSLVPLLGNGGCFTLAWVLVHAIESAPDYCIDESLCGKKFIDFLKLRKAKDAGCF